MNPVPEIFFDQQTFRLVWRLREITWMRVWPDGRESMCALPRENWHWYEAKYCRFSYLCCLNTDAKIPWSLSFRSHDSPPWSGMGGLPKMLKYWLYIDIWPFYGEVKLASLCICVGSMRLYGKNVENFKQLLLWSLWTSVAQIPCGASLGQGNERVLKWSQSIDQDGCNAHIL